jgi:hypothetical protein
VVGKNMRRLPAGEDDMHISPPENRWTMGNILSSSIGLVTLLSVLGTSIANSNNVPNIQKQANDNTTAISSINATIKDMQQTRTDDRQEILSRLDRIEAKLDTKADKTDQARGWTR